MIWGDFGGPEEGAQLYLRGTLGCGWQSFLDGGEAELTLAG